VRGEFHCAGLASLRGRSNSRGSVRSQALKKFPRRGRTVPETHRDAVRELFVKSYRLTYEIQENRIAILAFLHGSRNFPAGLN
jgi:plasmid stabilization system protein ParE